MGGSRREGVGGGEGGASEEARPSRLDDESDEAPGPFPSWGWLYAAVIVYTAGLTLLLWVFSVTLDHSVP